VHLIGFIKKKFYYDTWSHERKKKIREYVYIFLAFYIPFPSH